MFQPRLEEVAGLLQTVCFDVHEPFEGLPPQRTRPALLQLPDVEKVLKLDDIT